MATKEVLLDPGLLSSPDQTPQEERNRPFNPAFRNTLQATFLREAMNRKMRAGDVGWEDTTYQVTVPDTGYKNFDRNHDNKVTIADLKRFGTGKRRDPFKRDLDKIEQALGLGKTQGDTGWEDIYKYIRRRGWLGYYYDKQLVQEGYNQADFNHDGRVDKEDIFSIWVKYNKPNLELLKKAYGKTVDEPGWEDKIETITIPGTGYKNADLNIDNKIDEKDLMLLFSVAYEDGSLIKGTAETTYLMMGGTKKLIPDEKTFKNLGFDKSKIITISDEELNIIPDGEKIPEIKYDNGTLIKKEGLLSLVSSHFATMRGNANYNPKADLNNDGGIDITDLAIAGMQSTSELPTYYLMSYGLKRQIPDEETLKSLNLDKSKVVELSNDEFGKIPLGEPMPTSKYADASLIKGPNNELYLMVSGLKKKIPNEHTLKNLDLDETKAILVSEAELKNIPGEDKVPHFEYPIGTILKNSETDDDQYYLITPLGQKKLIQNTKTLENLGLDISQVKQVSPDKLSNIPDDPEAFPHLEYPNGSILRGDNNKLYMTSWDNKIEIPNKTTWEALGLNIKEQTISIRAKGKEDGGSFPLVQLRIDGEIIKEWFVTDEYKDYTVTVPLTDGKHKIDIVYPNDQDINTWLYNWVDKIKHLFKTNYYHHYESRHSVSADRELYVDYIQIGDKKIETDDSIVKYDQGANQKPSTYFDNVNVIPGQEKMVLPGALRLELNIENTVKASEKQLEDLHTVSTLPEAKYPNGTLLQAEDGTRYLMERGLRRLIPNQTTFEALGFNQQEIKTIPIAELELIDKGESLPKVKYANGELIKGSDGQVHYMIGGIKKPIADDPALHRIIGEKINLIEVSTRWEAQQKYWKHWGIEPWMKEGIDYKKEYKSNPYTSTGGGYIFYKTITDYYAIEDGKRKSINASEVPDGTIVPITRWEAQGKYWHPETWMREGIDYKREYERYGSRRDVFYKAITDYYVVEKGRISPIKDSDIGVVAAKRFVKNVPDEDIQSIPDGTPIKSPYLVKGSGNAVYLVSNDQKRYVPGGSFTFESYGFDLSKVKTLSDEELANIPTDEGLPRVEYSTVYKESKSWLKSALSFGISLIPGIGQYYNLMCAITGKDAITGADLSKGSRFMSALNGIDAFTSPKIDQATKALDAAKKADDIAKIGDLTQKLNNLQKITKFTNFAKTIYLGSATAFGKDIFGDRIDGYNRFLSGLSYASSGVTNLPFASTLNPQIAEYVSRTYKFGIGVTGNQNIFGGKELTDEQRFNLVASTVAPYLGRAIGDLPKEGLGAFKEEAERFISDLGTGLNLIAKSPIYAYNYVANAYQSNMRYKNYLSGEVDINNLTGKELVDLMKRIETDNNKLNDSKLGELSGELAERFTNTDITNRITQLERLNNLTGLSDAQKQMLEALNRERDVRIQATIDELRSAINPIVADVNGNIGYYDQKRTEKALADFSKLGGEFKDGGIITYPSINEPGQSTTTSIVGLDAFVKNWWLGIAADIGISSIPVIGKIYDAFTVIIGDGFSGPLNPVERILVAGTLLSPIPGGSGLKAAVRNALEIARGFENVAQYHKITGGLQEIARSLDKGDEIIGIRGSSVRGTSFHTGKPFGEGSDIDFFIVSDELIKRFRKYGIEPDQKGKILLDTKDYIENLNKIPEFKKWVEMSSKELGKETSIAIWKNEAFENIVKKEGDYILYNK